MKKGKIPRTNRNRLCIVKAAVFIIVMISVVFVLSKAILVRAEDTIQNGISIGGMDLSGMTEEEATQYINSYIEDIKTKEVTFVVALGNKVTTNYGNLGIYWANPEIIKQAVGNSDSGNVIARYKAKKDIEFNGKDLELSIKFDNTAVEYFLNTECKQYDDDMINASLKRENGEFVIIDGQPGEALDTTAAMVEITDNLLTYYNQGITEVSLPVTMAQPEGSYEQLSQIKDLLGTYTTSYSSSGKSRSANVENGCAKINGTVLYPGEEFSAYEKVKPFTEDNGYYLAGSYMNGQVVESFGGGICQVSSTLYNAVLLSELEVTERNNHSMVVTYVPKSQDAAIAESSGKDFKFKNNTEYPIYIEGITEDKKITFNIYGVETRPENRTVEYESEVLSQTDPADVLVGDASLAVGTVSTTSKHIGYNSRLWKIVYIDGEEVSRDIVNTSKYSPSARTVRIGTATDNPDYASRINAALATGDSNVCQAVAAQIKAEQQQLYDMIILQQQQQLLQQQQQSQ